MSKESPLVSVVCLCYNHEQYVVEAIDSVLSQTYDNIELIVVDDASSDNSQQVIKTHLQKFSDVKFIRLSDNVGNCKAFNIGWQASSGEYVIDLAADDILFHERVSVGVDSFNKNGQDYGVHFTDAQMINREGAVIRDHRTTLFFSQEVPQGIIFRVLLSKYFINPVTMMYSRALLDYLGGYDETLAYEDFDLWIRSSKNFKYCFTDQILVSKRILSRSHGGNQYRPGSKILPSTFKVCQKAYAICEDRDDFMALLTRIHYELKMSIYSLNWITALNFLKLKKKVMKRINAAES